VTEALLAASLEFQYDNHGLYLLTNAIIPKQNKTGFKIIQGKIQYTNTILGRFW